MCNSDNVYCQTFRVLGINASGLTSKVESFDKVLFDRKPSIWFMQETKRKPTDPHIKAKNLVNYQIFAMQRVKTKEEGGKGAHGGGLAVGALNEISPDLIRQGNNDISNV